MAKEKEEPKQEEKTPKEKFVIGEIATQTAPVIVEAGTETTYTELTALAKIMNDIEKLKSLL